MPGPGAPGIRFATAPVYDESVRILLIAICLLGWRGAAAAEMFVTGLAGTAALSGKSIIQAAPLSAANYEPAVGPAANVAAGWHFNDWFSAQGSYIWNRNRVTFNSLAGNSLTSTRNTHAQHAVSLDAMMYFRPSASRLRPYLSAGPGFMIALDEHKPALRVAVGIDIAVHDGWKFRYSFSEMMSGNPFAERLVRPATGSLMIFQNLFGFVKTF
jgi:hypothetical protein